MTFKGLILHIVIERNSDSVSDQEEKEVSYEEQRGAIQFAHQ